MLSLMMFRDFYKKIGQEKNAQQIVRIAEMAQSSIGFFFWFASMYFKLKNKEHRKILIGLKKERRAIKDAEKKIL